MKTKFYFDPHGDASTTADLKQKTAQPQRSEPECICEPRHINCPVHGTLNEQPPATDDHKNKIKSDALKLAYEEKDIAGVLANSYKQEVLQVQAAIAEHNKAVEEWSDEAAFKITVDLSALDKHDAEVRAKIWREAPDQSDVQEAVIAKLDLVHRHAIDEVRKPLVDALEAVVNSINGNEYARELARHKAKDALAKVGKNL